MILDRMVVYQLHRHERNLDQDIEERTTWLRVVQINPSMAARLRVWAGSVLIRAGTALRATALPELAAVSSPCKSD